MWHQPSAAASSSPPWLPSLWLEKLAREHEGSSSDLLSMLLGIISLKTEDLKWWCEPSAQSEHAAHFNQS